jgi:hypothetical protein
MTARPETADPVPSREARAHGSGRARSARWGLRSSDFPGTCGSSTTREAMTETTVLGHPKLTHLGHQKLTHPGPMAAGRGQSARIG